MPADTRKTDLHYTDSLGYVSAMGQMVKQILEEIMQSLNFGMAACDCRRRRNLHIYSLVRMQNVMCFCGRVDYVQIHM